MSDLGLQYASGILVPNSSQASNPVQVNAAGDNLSYERDLIDPTDPTRTVHIFPVAEAQELAVGIAEPQTTQLTIPVALNTVTEFAYELTARGGFDVYDRRGTILTSNVSGTVTAHTAMTDRYTPIADITGASADVAVSGSNLIVRTVGGSSVATTWHLTIWKTETPLI